MIDRKLLLEQLDRLAIVLDELMPLSAEVVRNAIELLKEQERQPVIVCPHCGKRTDLIEYYKKRAKDKLSSMYGIREDENNG